MDTGLSISHAGCDGVSFERFICVRFFQDLGFLPLCSTFVLCPPPCLGVVSLYACAIAGSLYFPVDLSRRLLCDVHALTTLRTYLKSNRTVRDLEGPCIRHLFDISTYLLAFQLERCVVIRKEHSLRFTLLRIASIESHSTIVQQRLEHPVCSSARPRRLAFLSFVAFLLILAVLHQSPWSSAIAYEQLSLFPTSNPLHTSSEPDQKPLWESGKGRLPWELGKMKSLVDGVEDTNRTRPTTELSWRKYMKSMLTWPRPKWDGHWPPFGDYIGKDYDPNRWEHFDMYVLPSPSINLAMHHREVVSSLF